MKVKITIIASNTLLQIEVPEGFGGTGDGPFRILHPGQSLFGKSYDEYATMGEGEHEWDDTPPERINLKR
jgi:hypothetical protein